MKTIIYTALFGGKDTLRDPKFIEDDVEYICFSDQPQISKVWKCVQIFGREKVEVDPCRAAKIYKIVPHRFPVYLECDRSIWVDASVEIMGEFVSMFDGMTTDLAFFKHSLRYQNCIYEEARQCIRKRYDDEKVINKAIQKYKAIGHPERWGLPTARIIFRFHNDKMSQFNEQWWYEIREGSRRDQISLPVVLRTMKMPFQEFDPTYLYNLKRPSKSKGGYKIQIHPHLL